MTSSESDAEDVDYSVPKDGTVYTVEGVGTVLVYEVSIPDTNQTMRVMYIIKDDNKDKTDTSKLTQGGTISEADFDARYPAALKGGNSIELDSIDEDTFGAYWDNTLMEYAGYNRVALEDAEVMGVLYQALLDGASVEEMQAKLSKTQWARESNNQTKKWDLATDLERDEMKGTFAGQLSEAWRSSWGIVPPLEDPRMADLTLRVSNGTTTYGEAVNEIRDAAMEDPRTPEAERRRELNRREVDIENTRQEVQKEARDYGINMSDRQLQQWSTGIVDLETAATYNDFVEWAQQQAESTFGSREAGSSTRGRDQKVSDWAAPHMEAYSGLMEVNDDVDLLFNDAVRGALTDQSSVADFKTAIRESDAWKATDNAREGVMNTVGDLSRLMGY